MASRRRLFNRGFNSLLVTQFLGAANDNILKQCLVFMVATGIWSGSLAEGGLGEGGQVVPTICLTAPFILMSGYAGQIADRFSKRSVTLVVKLAELPIALLAMLGFCLQNLWLTLVGMLLLATQSAFFGPAKYGMIPELVEERELSRANGLLNMLTNLAVIVGSLAAGPLSDLFDPKRAATVTAQPVLWAPGAALVVIALLGIVSALFMPKLEAHRPDLKYDLNPFRTYGQSLRQMAKGPLLAVVLAWSAFYMIGMIALLVLPEYERILSISYTKTSYLLGLLGVAIAIGSVITGVISGDRIRPNLIPIGALGMTVCFVLLGVLTPSYGSVALLIFLAGFSAGFYIIPLQALMQYLSPHDERGRFLGTANALSFCFTTFGALLFWVASNPIGMPANRIHLICGALALVGVITGWVYFRRIAASHAK